MTNLASPYSLFRRFLRPIALALVLCGSAHAADPVQLNFGGSVTWAGQIPIMVAIDKGFFKERNLDVTFVTILNSSDRVRAVTAGSVAFSNLGGSAVIADMSRGNHAFYYFANIDDTPGSDGCVARPGIDSIAALRGKKVAANTSAEIALIELLADAGMTEKDVTYLDLPPDQLTLALAKGNVDAACVWQPLLDQMKKSVPGGKLLGTDMDTSVYRQFHMMASPDIVIISAKLADEHPDQARAIAEGMFAGVAFTKAHPAEAAATVAHYFHKTPDEVLALIKNFTYFGQDGWQEHMRLQKGQMLFLSKLLYDYKKIPAVPDVEKWENVSFIPKP